MLVAALLLVLAFSAWLGIPALLTAASRSCTARATSDVHARIPALGLVARGRLAGATLAVYQTTVTRLWPIARRRWSLRGVAVGGMLRRDLQRFVVAPNEQVRETPYIVHNISATRAAFALDGVEERELSGDAQLTRADIERNATTFDNVPLWNEQPLLDTFGQIQEIRTYYDFVSVDNDRYMIDGKYRQIMLSARELNSASLPSRTWINERLTFTHGYGLTLGPGEPGHAARGCRCSSSRTCRRSPRSTSRSPSPPIYFGELSNDHVFVKTATPEFDYPTGDDNVFATLRRATAASRSAALLAPAAVRHPLRLHRHALLAEPHRREPRADLPAHRRARAAHRAVPDLRQRSVPGDRRRPAGLDPGRLHDEHALPVLDAVARAASTTSATR